MEKIRDERALRFMEKHQIQENAIKYILREDEKTSIYLINGQVVTTYMPVKSLLSVISADSFLNVNKGVVLNASQVAQIDKGVYTMADGNAFKGRIRVQKEHRRNQYVLEGKIKDQQARDALDLKSKYGIMDAFPLAVCVVELVFDQNGRGIDFLLRYCNSAMETLEGIDRNTLLNKSFFQIFRDGDRKWLGIFLDVCLAGTEKVINDHRQELDKGLKIYCYQTEPGFCACVLVEVDPSDFSPEETQSVKTVALNRELNRNNMHEL